MKKQTKIIYLSFIAFLVVVIIFQVVKNRNKDIPSISLLLRMIDDKKAMLGCEKFYENITAKNVSDLTEYCINNNNEDSINKLIRLAVSSEEFNILLNNINLDKEHDKRYVFKILEYFALARMSRTLYDGTFKFEKVQVKLFSNTQFNNKRLKLGEKYEAYITLIMQNSYEPVRIGLEEAKDTLYSDNYMEYTRPSIRLGEQNIKGKGTFLLWGRSSTLPFEDTYVVK